MAVGYPTSKEEIDETIAIPKRLITDDGRELLITGWAPDVQMDDVIRVTVTAIIAEDGGK